MKTLAVIPITLPATGRAARRAGAADISYGFFTARHCCRILLLISLVFLQTPGFADSGSWESYINAINVAEQAGNFSEGKRLFDEMLSRAEELGREDPRFATLLNDLAATLDDEGYYDKAESMHMRALAIREDALGPVHADVAQSLYNLGILYKDQGRYDEAEQVYVRALEIWENALGDKHVETADVLGNLCVLNAERKRYSDAEPLCRRDLLIREKYQGSEPMEVSASLSNLAATLIPRKRYAEAGILLERALAIGEKAVGLEHAMVTCNIDSLAKVYVKQDRFADLAHLWQRTGTTAAKEDPSHVYIDKHEKAYTTYISIQRVVSPDDLEDFDEYQELVEWGEFEANPAAYIWGNIVKNDYAQPAQFELGLVEAVRRNRNVSIGLTWNGGVAITGNDHRHAVNRYQQYSRDPETYSAISDSRGDPVHPRHWLPRLMSY